MRVKVEGASWRGKKLQPDRASKGVCVAVKDKEMKVNGKGEW